MIEKLRSQRLSDEASDEFVDTRWLVSRLHTKIHHLQSKTLVFIKEASGYRIVSWFRSYSAFSVVASSAFLVSASNFSYGHDTNLLLFGYAEGVSGEQQESSRFYQPSASGEKKDNLSLVPLAQVSLNADPTQKDSATLFDINGVSGQDQIVLSSQTGGRQSMSQDPEEDGGVKIYTVADGDTVSGIATKYGITVNTILWANDLDNPDQIKPGDQIFILPVSGLSYAVKAGDTLASIGATYKADTDKIISFNNLPANGEVAAGDVIIIPDGQKDEPTPRPALDQNGLSRREYATTGGGTATDISGSKTLSGKAGTGHRFPYGWCTWYVSQKRYVPWSGNAGTWLYKAKALGYKTGKSPQAGAIMVTTENRFYGHVALVEKVKGDTITVSEMNYQGWGKTSRRTLSASSRAIKGFIY